MRRRLPRPPPDWVAGDPVNELVSPTVVVINATSKVWTLPKNQGNYFDLNAGTGVLVVGYMNEYCLIDVATTAGPVHAYILKSALKGPEGAPYSPGGDVPYGFVWPVPDKKSDISAYGARKYENDSGGYSKDYHEGTDIPEGSNPPAGGYKVVAVADGMMKRDDRMATAGVRLLITHSNGYVTVYQHLKEGSAIMTNGAKAIPVKQGQKIAVLGDSGNVTGPHLHFEIWRYMVNRSDGSYTKRPTVNPLQTYHYFDKRHAEGTNPNYAFDSKANYVFNTRFDWSFDETESWIGSADHTWSNWCDSAKKDLPTPDNQTPKLTVNYY